MIEISHLSKRFGSLLVIDDLSLTLVPGEVLGFLGPNGAGKSTTMKMLAGFLSPSQGDISIYGLSIRKAPIPCQQIIGYLPEGAPAYEEMTVAGFLAFIAEIRGFKGGEKSSRVHAAITKMSLDTVLNQPIETLSKGFKRRVGLAQAILHDPKVLILDEPTDGLDPNQKHQVRQLIRGLSRDKIVIISTHILEEVRAVCSRVVIISSGRLQIDCTPDALERRSEYHGAVTIALTAEDHIIRQLAATLSETPAVKSVQTFRNGMTVFPANNASPLFTMVNQCLNEADITPTGLFHERGRLDDVFRQITLGDRS